MFRMTRVFAAMAMALPTVAQEPAEKPAEEPQTPEAREELSVQMQQLMESLEESAQQWAAAAEQAFENRGEWSQQLEQQWQEWSEVVEAEQQELTKRLNQELAALKLQFDAFKEEREQRKAEEQPAQPEIVHRIVEVEYDFDRAMNIAQSFTGADAFDVARGSVVRKLSVSPETPRLTITSLDDRASLIGLSGPKEVVDLVEAAIREHDVPPKNVELVVYMLRAMESPVDAAVPEVLQPVVEQLSSMFPYKGYQLLDTTVLRVRDGSNAEISSTLPATAFANEQSGPAEYTVVTRAVQVFGSEATGYSVRVDDLSLGIESQQVISVGNQDGGQTRQRVTQQRHVGISTNVDIPEGQKVVVGKSSMDDSRDALFVVMTASVLD